MQATACHARPHKHCQLCLLLCRPLAPGAYTVTAVMRGYENATATVIVPSGDTGISHTFELIRLDAHGKPATKAAEDRSAQGSEVVTRLPRKFEPRGHQHVEVCQALLRDLHRLDACLPGMVTRQLCMHLPPMNEAHNANVCASVLRHLALNRHLLLAHVLPNHPLHLA